MSNEAVEVAMETDESAPAAGTSTDITKLRRKDKLVGKVTRLELYGAFIDIGLESQAILHVSKLGRKVNRVADVLNVGDEVTVWVDEVDAAKGQVTVTLIEPVAVDWRDLEVDQTHLGIVTRLEKFGAFVDIGAEKEGLIHVSELSNEYVKHPSEAVKVGEEIEVKVIGFSKKKRRIDLSRKQLAQEAAPGVIEPESDETDLDEDETLPTAMEIALRRAMQGSPTTQPAGSVAKKGRKRSRSLRQQQEDILSRTLSLDDDST